MSAVTSKGQVTIPKRLRDALGLRPGSSVAFELEPTGRVYLKREGRPEKSALEKRLEKARGSMKGKFTTAEIMRLTRGWS